MKTPRHNGKTIDTVQPNPAKKMRQGKKITAHPVAVKNAGSQNRHR
jgi:hypothetical protein